MSAGPCASIEFKFALAGSCVFNSEMVSERFRMESSSSHVFITGGTGYIGSRLIPRLAARGHKVSALVRPESAGKLPATCEAVTGDALNAASYRDRIRPATTFVQLVGVSHPSPAKAVQFRSIDLVAGREAVAAAVFSGIQHFVYVSVAQPAPMMKAYMRSAGKMRGRHPGERPQGHDPAARYVLGPRPPLALRAGPWLLAAGAVPGYPRRCASAGSRYLETDAADSHQSCCLACTERPRPRCAGDPRG